MNKTKIDLSKYANMHDEVTIEGNDKTEVTVRNHIPYEEKYAMARELVEYTAVIHDDSCVYSGPDYDKVRINLIAKYYTNIETEDIESNAVVDFIINNGLYEKIKEIISDDFDHAIDIYWNLYDAFEKTYSDDKSLTKAIRTSFGFLFNGEDITESLAKAEAMKDTIYEAVGALRKVEKEKEEKLDNGTLTIGGNVINFAKKN